MLIFQGVIAGLSPGFKSGCKSNIQKDSPPRKRCLLASKPSMIPQHTEPDPGFNYHQLNKGI